MSETTSPGGDDAQRENQRPPAEPPATPRPEAAREREQGPPRADRFGGRGRPRDRDRGGEGGRRPPRRGRRPRRKVCAFCVDKVTRIDYKDHGRLREFISDTAKIVKSRVTGTCARHQRALSRAIKRARQVALLPFVGE